MYRMRTLAAGLAVAVSLGTGAMALAPMALASAARPAGTGSFRTWPAAQRAAGFGLYAPSRTYGLRPNGLISVDRCMAAGKLSKRSVSASYGSFLARWLSIQQKNTRGACGNFSEARVFGYYVVQGRRATMWGVCGKNLGPPCSSRKITLYLTWEKHGIYYVAGSRNEPRAVIVGFARGLRRV